MRHDKICIFAALLSLTLAACGEISHTELVADLSKNHIVHTLGGQRPALLVLPAAHDPETPIPLVLSLHGFTSHLAQHDRYFGLSKRRERRSLRPHYGQRHARPRWPSLLERHGLLLRPPQHPSR